MSNLDGIKFYGEPSLDQILTNNVITFLQHGFLEIGAFYNITIDKQDYNGNNLSILRPVNAPGVTGYKNYRSIKNDWAWEQGITFKYASGIQPIVTSGILVNGSFTSTGYIVDYSRGQIVFNNPLNSSAVVKCPHTLRAVSVYPYDSNEYRELNYEWSKVGGTGITDNFYQAYLPAVFVRIRNYDTIRGTELGSRAKFISANLQFTIFAVTDNELQKIIDLLYMLETKNLELYDWKNSPKPLNNLGQLVNSGSIWPNLIQNYKLGNARFNESARITKYGKIAFPVSKATVDIGLEMDVLPI